MDIAAVHVTQQPNSNITWPTDVCFQGLQAVFQVAPSDKAFVRACVRVGGSGRANKPVPWRPPTAPSYSAGCLAPLCSARVPTVL